jgi:hypothetical protein
MTVFNRVRSAQIPRYPLKIDRSTEIGKSLVGLVYCGDNVALDLVTGLKLTSTVKAGTAPDSIMPRGAQIRPISAANGVYTANRLDFPTWQISQPLTFFALWYISSYQGSTSTGMGFTGGSDGFRIGEQFGIGNRVYAAMGISILPGAVWPINTPILTVMTYSGGNLAAYLNGVADGTATGGAAITYGAFARLFAGKQPDGFALNGGVCYMGLCNSVLSTAAIATLSADPLSILAPAPSPEWWWQVGATGNTYNDGVTESGSAADSVDGIICSEFFPASDISSGSWVPSTGGSLFGTVDEFIADDSDYDKSSFDPSSDTMEVKFGSVIAPSVNTNHTIKYRISARSGANRAAQLVMSLYCGATLIKTWTHNPVPSTPTTYFQALTPSEANTISDYTDLRLRAVASKVLVTPSWLSGAAVNSWVPLPGTDLNSMDVSVLTAAGLNPGANEWGNPKTGILAYSGGTIRRSDSTFMIFGGGGSNAWAGNEWRGIGLEDNAPSWVCLTNPDPAYDCWLHADPAAAYNKDGITPQARHSYWAGHYIDATKRCYTFGIANTWSTDGSPPGNEKYHVDAILLATKTWLAPDTLSRPTSYPRAQDGNLILKNPSNEHIYWYGSTTIAEYDPSTDTWTSRYSQAGTDNDSAGGCVDPVNGVVLRFGDDGGTQNLWHEFAIGTSWTKTACTMSGPYAGTLAQYHGYWANGFVYDEGLGCFLMYQDDGFLYTITRTGTAAYTVDRLTMTGTPPTANQYGGLTGIWSRMQYVPNLKGVAIYLLGSNPIYFAKTS